MWSKKGVYIRNLVVTSKYKRNLHKKLLYCKIRFCEKKSLSEYAYVENGKLKNVENPVSFEI